MIERQKIFKIGEKSFTATFPNVGQMIDMESLKQALTNNRYGAMAQSGIITMYAALDIVDMIAFFQVCLPEVTQHFNIRNYTDLDSAQLEPYMKVYRDEIKPWFENTMKELIEYSHDGK